MTPRWNRVGWAIVFWAIVLPVGGIWYLLWAFEHPGEVAQERAKTAAREEAVQRDLELLIQEFEQIELPPGAERTEYSARATIDAGKGAIIDAHYKIDPAIAWTDLRAHYDQKLGERGWSLRKNAYGSNGALTRATFLHVTQRTSFPCRCGALAVGKNLVTHSAYSL